MELFRSFEVVLLPLFMLNWANVTRTSRYFIDRPLLIAISFVLTLSPNNIKVRNIISLAFLAPFITRCYLRHCLRPHRLNDVLFE